MEITREELLEQIDFILEKIRPYLQRHGGDVELVDINTDGVVYVKMLDNCDGCGIADITLKMGIEQALLEEIPQVTEVIAVN